MASEVVQDHDTYWADNPEMKTKTKEYERQAKEIVERGAFRSDTKHPWMESGFRVKTRVQLIEFRGDHFNQDNATQNFDNHRDLLWHFEGTPEDGSSANTNRRLIILEDMDPRFVEFLGVMLGIPPEFFLAHCEEYVSLSVMDKACTRETSSTHWKVSLPQKRQLPVGFQGPYGNYVIEAGNVSRLEINVSEHSRWIIFSSQVSYWGKRYGQDSWTAVLLVDPYKVNLRLKHPGPTDINTIINLDDFKPWRNFCAEVVVGSTSEKRTQPYERSIFDAMVNAHRHSKIKDTEDPFSATAYARNFIRATWEEEIWWNQMEFHDKVFEDEMQHRVCAQHNSLDSWTGKGEKGVEEYQKLIGERQSLKRMRNSLRGILWSFRCKDPDFLESQEIELKELIRRENKMWLFLDEKLEVMETTVSNHMEMYAQRASMVESFAANRKARSASQLTKIATVIVPCTFVASIFSMGGEFAAGQSLFGVYWAVSIPATLVLLAWVLYGHNIPPAWGRVKGWVGRPKTVSSRNWQITLSKRH